jgi:hypothetical protein
VEEESCLYGREKKKERASLETFIFRPIGK